MKSQKACTSIIAPATAQGQEQSAQAPQEILYFSWPKALQYDEAYSTVLSVLQRRHPDARILAPKELWGDMSIKAWQAVYRQQLAAVTCYYIVADVYGYVGHACYVEWQYFQSRGIQARAFLPEFADIVPVGRLLASGQNWRQYARVLPVAERDGE